MNECPERSAASYREGARCSLDVESLAMKIFFGRDVSGSTLRLMVFQLMSKYVEKRGCQHALTSRRALVLPMSAKIT